MKQYYEIDNIPAWIERANKYYDLYRTEAGRKVYVAVVNDELCGFALVNSTRYFNEIGRSIAEFYIEPEKHRNGYGRRLAEYVFEQHPGQWEVRVTRGNESAYMFWNNVITQYIGDKFTVQGNESYDGKAFTFCNA